MLNKYDSWIRDYTVANKGNIYRKCVEATTQMQQAFPELQIAKGLVQIFEDEKWYPH
jgi:hypothetical protein